MLRAMQKAIRARREHDFGRIAAAIRYIGDNVQAQPSLERMAAAAGLSPYHFARTFRRWAGISPKQYLQRLTLDLAQKSLAGSASVLDAALDAGLSGPGRLHDLSIVLDAVTPGESRSRGDGLAFGHGEADTPFGAVRVVTTPRGIAFLGFVEEGGLVPGWEEFRARWTGARWHEDDEAAQRTADSIWASAGSTSARGLRLWIHGTNFQIQVWRALLGTARDSTVNYADIAREIGRPTAARAVGSAVGANPVAWLIPCHHVLRANGALGGYRWGIDRKRAMLAWEYAHSVAADR
jgi:AraC family transcriptional regulator of adaptative response/methylated-DNA-[protein]-cysteine methyltransferase